MDLDQSIEQDLVDLMLLEDLDDKSALSDPNAELDAIEKDSLKFSDSVEKALASIANNDDPFSKPDFNITAYINQLFPTEQSLCNIDDVMLKVRTEIEQMNCEIAELVQNQNAGSLDGQKIVIDAKLSIHELFSKIREIKSKTDMSENMVKEITRDIKQLDVAKKNLTASITTLNHLHMLLSSVELLQNFSKTKSYDEIANLLPAITSVLEHFTKYLTISQIKELSDKVQDIKSQLTVQVVTDFKDYFVNPSSVMQASKSNSGRQRRLYNISDVCHVISSLDKSVYNEMTNWVIQRQLAEYLLLFDETQDIAWLDKIDERYKWFCNKLSDFEEKYSNIFPPDWILPQRMACDFCRTTKTMLEKLMAKRRLELNVKLLMYAVQRTNNFEALMCKRFPHNVIYSHCPDVGQLKNVTDDSSTLTAKNWFIGSIGQVFDAYMDVYVQAQDSTLNQLIEQILTKIYDGSGLPSRKQQNLDQAAVTLTSSGDIFMVYKKCIQQTIQITSDCNVLVDLAQIFKKHLREYASKCLSMAMPKMTCQSQFSAATSTASLIQSLLKEGESAKLTRDEIYVICCVLTTAEFCSETIGQLQEKLKEKIKDICLHSKLDMNAEQDCFHSVVANCVQVLVRDLESCCEPALQTMTKMQWSTIDHVGDESRYIANIRSHIKTNVPMLRDHLCNARKYFAQFCLKFASCLMAKFTSCVFRCKPISEEGAEQLLLDAHSLKTELLNLPNVEMGVARKPPTSYTNVVNKGLGRVEMILKLVMTKAQDPENFVNQYLKLMPDSDVNELQKVLEMKGWRGNGQLPFLEIFRKKSSHFVASDSAANTNVGVSIVDSTMLKQFSQQQFPTAVNTMNAYLTGVVGQAVAAADPESTIKKLEKLVRKRVT